MDTQTKTRPHADMGRMLKSARRRANLTQREVGAKSGIPIRMLQEYEQGRCFPGTDRLLKLMRILEIDLMELFALVDGAWSEKK